MSNRKKVVTLLNNPELTGKLNMCLEPNDVIPNLNSFSPKLLSETQADCLLKAQSSRQIRVMELRSYLTRNANGWEEWDVPHYVYGIIKAFESVPNAEKVVKLFQRLLEEISGSNGGNTLFVTEAPSETQASSSCATENSQSTPSSAQEASFGSETPTDPAELLNTSNTASVEALSAAELVSSNTPQLNIHASSETQTSSDPAELNTSNAPSAVEEALSEGIELAANNAQESSDTRSLQETSSETEALADAAELSSSSTPSLLETSSGPSSSDIARLLDDISFQTNGSLLMNFWKQHTRLRILIILIILTIIIAVPLLIWKFEKNRDLNELHFRLVIFVGQHGFSCNFQEDYCSEFPRTLEKPVNSGTAHYIKPIIYIVSENEDKITFQYFNLLTKKPKLIDSINRHRAGCTVTEHHGLPMFTCCGGHNRTWHGDVAAKSCDSWILKNHRLVYKPDYSYDFKSFTKFPDALVWPTVKWIDGRLYIIGGIDWKTKEPLNLFIALDPSPAPGEGEVVHLPPLPYEAHGVAATSKDGSIFVCGGYDSDGDMLADCWKFLILKAQWLPLSPMTKPRAHFSLLVIDRFLCAVFGAKANINYMNRRSIECMDMKKRNDGWMKMKTIYDIPFDEFHIPTVPDNIIGVYIV